MGEVGRRRGKGLGKRKGADRRGQRGEGVARRKVRGS